MTLRSIRVVITLALTAGLVTGCAGVGTSTLPASPSETAPASPSASSTMAPSASSTPTVAPSLTPTPTRSPSTPSPSPQAVTHTVVAGESLSLIASRYDTTWQSIVYWNLDSYPSLDPKTSVYNPNRIDVGWRLVVWPGLVVAYDPPLPTSTPGHATPAPVPGGPGLAVFHGDRSSSMVALTFDMGGRTEPAVEIMTWLREHGVAATIFMTGSSVDGTAAGREVLSIINSRPDLFDLGNHSYSHPDLTTLSSAGVTDELRRAEAAIDRYADDSPRPLFRPPFGAWSPAVLAAAASAGYPWTVLWDVDTIDWKPIGDGGPTAQAIVARVRAGAQGGSIVLMHLGGYETLRALPDVVAALRADGYSLVTLGRLIGA